MKLFRRKTKNENLGAGRIVKRVVKRVQLEPEVSENDIVVFFAKLDAEERNVPAAMIAQWKQMAVEKMEQVKDAESFAFEQGRLAAYCEMEKLFIEMAEQYRNAAPTADEGDDGNAA